MDLQPAPPDSIHITAPPISMDPSARWFSRATREARARLKHHLLMARLRCGLRSFMEPSSMSRRREDVWRECLLSELDHVMTNIGYCAISGFPIEHPYWLEELAEVIYSSHPDGDEFIRNLMKAINSEQTMYGDNSILSMTPQVQYWWRHGAAAYEVEEIAASTVALTRSQAEQHLSFYINVLKSNGHNLDSIAMAPAEIPEFLTQAYRATAYSQREDDIATTSPNHSTAAKSALKKASTAIKDAYNIVDSAIARNRESMDTSIYYVDAYVELQRLTASAGRRPFQHGRLVPELQDAVLCSFDSRIPGRPRLARTTSDLGFDLGYRTRWDPLRKAFNDVGIQTERRKKPIGDVLDLTIPAYDSEASITTSGSPGSPGAFLNTNDDDDDADDTMEDV